MYPSIRNCCACLYACELHWSCAYVFIICINHLHIKVYTRVESEIHWSNTFMTHSLISDMLIEMGLDKRLFDHMHVCQWKSLRRAVDWASKCVHEIILKGHCLILCICTWNSFLEKDLDWTMIWGDISQILLWQNIHQVRIYPLGSYAWPVQETTLEVWRFNNASYWCP